MKAMSVLPFIFILAFAYSAHANTGTDQKCNEVFDSVKLRYGDVYIFYNDFYNSGNAPLKIKGNVSQFLQRGSYGNDMREIAYTDWIKEKRGIINPNEKGRTVEYRGEYTITHIPQQRLKDNVYIVYKTDYVTFVDGKEIDAIKTHISCQPYEITWCGDGIVDNEFGEKYDDGINNGKLGFASKDCKRKLS